MTARVKAYPNLIEANRFPIALAWQLNRTEQNIITGNEYLLVTYSDAHNTSDRLLEDLKLVADTVRGAPKKIKLGTADAGSGLVYATLNSGDFSGVNLHPW